MEKVANFKRMEVNGVTKDEALAQAPFEAKFDATQAYNIWKNKQTAVTSEAEKEFMLEYLAKKTKNIPGAGCYITVHSAVLDSRNRPYKITNIKNEGTRKMKRDHQWIDINTGTVISRGNATQAAAKEAFKKVVTEGGYRGKARCEVVYNVVEGNPVCMTGEYAPSKGTHNGVYKVFGIVSDND